MSQWIDPEQHAERAEQFYRAGQWERALDALREALDQRPHEGDWLFGLGLTLDALHRYEEAAEAYEKARLHRGEDVPVLLHLGVDLLRAGRPEEAIETLAQANLLDENLALGYAHRVLAHALLGDHDRAELMFYLARQCANEAAGAAQAVAYDHLAQSLTMRQDTDRAVWCWQEALRLDPSHPEANRSLALVFQQRGQDERARLHYQRQLRLSPDDVETRLDFADMLFAANRLAEARDAYRRSLEADDTLAVARLRLGELALINGRPDEATGHYEHARGLDSTLPGVHLGLATAARRRGEDHQARHWLLLELEQEGQSAEQALDAAGLLVELGLNHQAVRFLDPLLSGADDLLMSSDGHYATALLCRGVALVARGHFSRGIEDCRRSVQLAPDNPAVFLQLAAAHFQAGHLGEARRWLRRGRRRWPADPHLRRLGRRLILARLARVFGRLPGVARRVAN